VTVARLEDAKDPNEFGGKAFHLGAALRAGLPVPPGFGVSVTALSAVCRGDRDVVSQVSAAFAALGIPKAGGTKMTCLTGHVNKPGVYELRLGFPVKQMIEEVGGGIRNGRKLKAFIPGGSSCPVLTAAELELMNLTGDGNGFDMLTMPQALRVRVPTANFFQQQGYERNPVARRTGVVANLIADIEIPPDERLESDLEVSVGGRRMLVGPRTYDEAPPGEPFAMRGSSGHLEVAVRQGSALEVLGRGVGTPVCVHRGKR